MPRQSSWQCTQIASDSICAFYYNDYHARPYNHVIGAIPAINERSVAVPAFPIYRTAVPGYGLFPDEWFYSEAPLDGVVRAQLCIDRGFCIGLVLQYESCSRSVGQFRYDKNISEWFQQPFQIGVVHERDRLTSKVRINFVTTEPATGTGTSESVQPESIYQMTGVLVWWYAKEISDIKILPL
jgi:hypothetical protein